MTLSPQTTKPSVIATGIAVGLNELTGLLFDINCPWTCCRVCGAIYQSKLDRTVGDLGHNLTAMELRREWSVRHARLHTEKEHLSLALSGRSVTPEAAEKLAAFGVIPLVDMVMDEEVKSSLAEARAIPINDAEGGE